MTNPDDNDQFLPKKEASESSVLHGRPSRKTQSWGAIISIIVIVFMIIIGAFYSWGKRIAENSAPTPAEESSFFVTSE